MDYRHQFLHGRSGGPPPGKVVCVGRNYADHARELDNDIPAEPLLFIKPASAIVPFMPTLIIPGRFGDIDYETEMTVLVGDKTTIAGVGIGLDLTRRELQRELKQKGHPWERAKAFDGSAVLSPFVPFDDQIDLQRLSLRLWRNGECVQDGNTGDMLFPVAPLLTKISDVFSLYPGDVIMTGTPAGVGRLAHGDALIAELDNLVRVETRVAIQ